MNLREATDQAKRDLGEKAPTWKIIARAQELLRAESTAYYPRHASSHLDSATEASPREPAAADAADFAEASVDELRRLLNVERSAAEQQRKTLERVLDERDHFRRLVDTQASSLEPIENAKCCDCARPFPKYEGTISFWFFDSVTLCPACKTNREKKASGGVAQTPKASPKSTGDVPGAQSTGTVKPEIAGVAPGPRLPSIEEIREAFHHIHHYAIGKTDRPYMEIPANPRKDADLILSAAIDELATLRRQVAKTDEALDEFGTHHSGKSLHESVDEAMCTLRRRISEESARAAKAERAIRSHL